MFTPEEYERLGRYMVQAIGVSVAIGHNSPATLGDYAARTADPLQHLVLDAFEAARIGEDGAPARARLARFADSSGLLDQIAAAVV